VMGDDRHVASSRRWRHRPIVGCVGRRLGPV
jgi:hypothetical protein